MRNYHALVEKVGRFFLLSIFVFGLSLSAAILLTGCARGPLDGDPTDNTAMETTSLYGQVISETGAPLQSVTVWAGTQSAISDKDGIFVIKNATVPKGRAVLVGKKPGYFNAPVAVVPGKTGSTRAIIVMQSSSVTTSIDASVGGTVNAGGGAKVKFEAGGFLTSSGAPYSGTVKVAAKYLDPESPTFSSFFAGDNTAQDRNGDQVGLISCGVLRVEITDGSGAELKLAPGKEATLTYPKTNDPNAPSAMPLWYFDEGLGMWKEDGTAELQGGVYTGKVSHFTDWNLDYKGDNGSLVFRIVCNGVPVEGVTVRVEDRLCVTGSDGLIRCVRVPADKPIEINITSTDNNGDYYIDAPISYQLTPNIENIYGDITLTSPCPATLYGTLVGCDDGIAEGLVKVTDGTNVKFCYTNTKTGEFSVGVKSGVTLTVSAIDVAGNNSTPEDVAPLASGEQRNIGALEVCGPLTANFVDIEDTRLVNSRVALSPDGSKLAVTIGDTVMIFSSSTGAKLMEFSTAGHLGSVSTAQFTPDNNRLFVMGYPNAIVFDVSGTSAVQLGSVQSLYWGVLTDDGTRIIGADYQKSKLTVYNATDGSEIRELSPEITLKDSKRFSNLMIYLRDEDAVVIAMDHTGGSTDYAVWSVSEDKAIRTFTLSWGFESTTISEDGITIAGAVDGTLYRTYNTILGTFTADIQTSPLVKGQFLSPLVTKGHFFRADTYNDGRVINCYSTTDGSIVGTRLVSGSSQFNNMAVNRNEDYLAASSPGAIRIWKLK